MFLELPMPSSLCLADAAPPTLDHVVVSGENQRVLDQVRITLESCYSTGQQYPHSLFCGSPGTGKSLYCSVIAKELGVEPVTVLGQTLSTNGDVHAALLSLDDGGVLVLDEIHTLSFAGQTILLRALENGEIFLEGSIQSRAPACLKLPRFTLLGATTDEYELLEPLRDRFRLTHRLVHFAAADLAILLARRAVALGWSVENEVFGMVAGRARGVPRAAIRLLESIYRTASATGSQVLEVAHAHKTFELEGLDALGLTTLERDYLRVLAEAGGPVRLNILATRLSAPPQTLTKMVEGYLVRCGLITKDESGRLLTPRGIEYARSKSP
jgi:Holliday junction DNA helicase RuvB